MRNYIPVECPGHKFHLLERESGKALFLTSDHLSGTDGNEEFLTDLLSQIPEMERTDDNSDANVAKAKLIQWAAEIPHHGLNYDEAEIVSLEWSPFFNVLTKTLTAHRSLFSVVLPCKGWSITEQEPISQDNIDVWSYKIEPPSEFTTTRDDGGLVENSQRVSNCEDCNSNGYVSCTTCDGTASISCPTCRGQGQWPCSACRGRQLIQQSRKETRTERCPHCSGGRCGLTGVRCSACRGTGTREYTDIQYYDRPCNSCRNGMHTCSGCYGSCYVGCSTCKGGPVNFSAVGAKGWVQ